MIGVLKYIWVLPFIFTNCANKNLNIKKESNHIRIPKAEYFINNTFLNDVISGNLDSLENYGFILLYNDTFDSQLAGDVSEWMSFEPYYDSSQQQTFFSLVYSEGIGIDDPVRIEYEYRVLFSSDTSFTFSKLGSDKLIYVSCPKYAGRADLIEESLINSLEFIPKGFRCNSIKFDSKNVSIINSNMYFGMMLNNLHNLNNFLKFEFFDTISKNTYTMSLENSKWVLRNKKNPQRKYFGIRGV